MAATVSLRSGSSRADVIDIRAIFHFMAAAMACGLAGFSRTRAAAPLREAEPVLQPRDYDADILTYNYRGPADACGSSKPDSLTCRDCAAGQPLAAPLRGSPALAAGGSGGTISRWLSGLLALEVLDQVALLAPRQREAEARVVVIHDRF